MSEHYKWTKEINKIINEVYRQRKEIRTYLQALSCPHEALNDVIQESILILSRKLESGDYDHSIPPLAYVKKTARFIWYNESRKSAKIKIAETNFEKELDQDFWEKEIKLRSIETAIESIGKKCQKLLRMFYGLGMDMVTIAKKLDFRNDKVAKAQKYRCMNKVKDLVKDQIQLNKSL